MRYEHPPIAFLLIGAAQEADLVSPGFWLRTIDSDLKPLNLGLPSALRRATDRPSRRRIMETAMLFERAT